MRRHSILATLILILALALPAAVAADDPPAPTTRHQFRVNSLPLVGLAEMVKFVNDFQPGAATPPHTHPGLVLVTVLEGELTFRTPRGDQVFRVGESFSEGPGEVVTAVNTGAVKTRVMVSTVVPKGAPPLAPQPGGPTPAPAAPTTLYLLRADAFFPGDPYEVAQVVLDFAPGAQTPAHTHPGQVFVTVLDGAITLRTGGAEKTYQVGESFVEQPEVAVQARNAGTTKATVLATYLLPKGAPFSTPVATPGMPNTGAGGGRHLPIAWLVLLAASTLALGGGLLKRRARRT
jgi:quercetin dioxygenase-like cupin family protein